MAVERDAATTTKDRPLPVDPAGLQTISREESGLLQDVLTELKTIRLILSAAFGIEIEPEDT